MNIVAPPPMKVSRNRIHSELLTHFLKHGSGSGLSLCVIILGVK